MVCLGYERTVKRKKWEWKTRLLHGCL